MKRTQETLVNVYLFMMLAVFPLYIHEGSLYKVDYYKYTFFTITSVAMLICCWLTTADTWKQLSNLIKRREIYLYFIFVTLAAVSTIFSEHAKEAFLGNAGRFNGLLTYIFYGMVLLVITIYGKIRKEHFVALEIAAALVCVLGVLNAFLIDPFGVFEGLDYAQKVTFTSTLGNIDFFSEYAAVILALSGALFCFEKKSKIRIFHVVIYLVSVAGLLTDGADGGFLGTILFFILLAFFLRNKKETVRASVLFLLFLVEVAILGIVDMFAIERRGYPTIVKILLQRKVLLYGLIVFGVLALAAWIIFYEKKMTETQVKRIKIAYAGVLGAVVIGGIILLWLFNSNVIPVPAGMEHFFRFDESWGSHRGYLWKNILTYYWNLPFGKKLIGIGPETLAYANEQFNAAAVLPRVDNAHNVYIHMLVTHGILGLLAWLAWVGNGIRLSLKRGKENRVYAALALALLAYYSSATVGLNCIILSVFIMMLLLLPNCEYATGENVVHVVMNKIHNFDGKVISKILVVAMFAFYPFIMTDGYFNVTITKYIVMLVTVIPLFFITVIMAYWGKKECLQPAHIWQAWKELKLMDKFVWLFLGSEVLAFLFSWDKLLAFTGSTNKYMGLGTAFAFGMLYYIVRKNGIERRFFLMVSQCAGCVVILFALLQFCKVDFFGMLEAITGNPVNNYLSTFGNTGVFGVYLFFIMGVAIYGYCAESDQRIRRLSGVTCFLCGVGTLISNTDATYLGNGILLLLMIVLFGSKKETAIRCVEVFFFQCCAGMSLFVLFSFRGHRALSSLGRLGTRDVVAAGGMLLCVIVWLVWNYVWKSETIYRKITRVIAWAAVACIGIVVILVVWCSVINRESNLGALSAYLRLNDDWGTGRGYIWNRLLSIFAEFSWHQKLFGEGQGSVMVLMMDHYYDEMLAVMGAICENAHNVYIQYLITIGINGLVMYLGILYATIKTGFKKGSSQWMKMLTAVIVAYAVVDIVSILQPITTPFLWIFLGVIGSQYVENAESSEM